MNTGFCELDQAYKRAASAYGSNLQGGTECRAPAPQASGPTGPSAIPSGPSGPSGLTVPTLTEGFAGDYQACRGRCTHCGRRDFALSTDDMIILGLAIAFVVLYFKKPAA